MPPPAQRRPGAPPDKPARAPGGSFSAEGSLSGVRVFCNNVQMWMDAEVVSIGHDSLMAEFDLGQHRCRKKLFNGSKDLSMPAAERRRVEAFQELLRPEDSDDGGGSHAEGAAGRARRPERVDQGAHACSSDESWESSSSQGGEGANGYSSLEEIDPGAHFETEHHAHLHVLDHIRVKQDGRSELQRISFADTGLIKRPRTTSPERPVRPVPRGAALRGDSRERGLTLTHYKHHSFAILQPFRGPAEVHYLSPKGRAAEDILVKVYVMQGSRHDEWDGYVIAEDSGGSGRLAYIHSTHQPDPVRVRAPRGGPFFIGLMVHRDLNVDWLWKKGPDELRRQLSRSTAGGWRAREEPEGKTTAKGTDYVLSWSAGNAEENNELARRLTRENVPGPHGNRPISFCTDRTLGFGQHLLTEKASETELAGLYLAKHGFGKSVLPGAWFDDYKEAIFTVNYGMLMVNVSLEYCSSQACIKEIGSVPRNKIHLLQVIDQKMRVISLDGTCGTSDPIANRARHSVEACRWLFQYEGGDERNLAGTIQALILWKAAMVCLVEEGPCDRAVLQLEDALKVFSQAERLGDSPCKTAYPKFHCWLDAADTHHACGNFSRAEVLIAKAADILSEIPAADAAAPRCPAADDQLRNQVANQRLLLSRGLFYLSVDQLDAAVRDLRQLARCRLTDRGCAIFDHCLQLLGKRALLSLSIDLGCDLCKQQITSVTLAIRSLMMKLKTDDTSATGNTERGRLKGCFRKDRLKPNSGAAAEAELPTCRRV